jgi:hypothetical protein
MAYNGWKNWSTWNVVLWFGNDEGLYHSLRDYDGRFNATTAEDFTLETFPNGTPDMKNYPPSKLRKTWGEVSWREVAKAFNELKGD